MSVRPLVEYRTAVGRAAKALRHAPSDLNRSALETARRDLAEAKIADYVARVLAEAPPLSDAQLDRLAQIVKPTGARVGVAA